MPHFGVMKEQRINPPYIFLPIAYTSIKDVVLTWKEFTNFYTLMINYIITLFEQILTMFPINLLHFLNSWVIYTREKTHTIDWAKTHTIKFLEVVIKNVATLTLGLRPRQGLAKVWAKNEAQESHFMLLWVWKSVGECERMNLHTSKWASTLGVGVPMDSQIFKEQLQNSKPMRLKSSLYH